MEKLKRKNPDEEIEEKILEIREKNKHYGLRRITAELKKTMKINIKKVHRIYKKLGIQITETKKTKPKTYQGTLSKIPNRIHRRFNCTNPNQKLFTDTTYVKIYDNNYNYHWGYINAFIDGFDRKIISYNVSDNMKQEPFIELVKETIEKTNDSKYRRTFHSDQGIYYFRKSYIKLLKENKIYQSMSRKGNCLDNSIIENFWSILKREALNKKIYSLEELQKTVDKYIEYYNNERIKEKNEWQSPNEKRKKYYA